MATATGALVLALTACTAVDPGPTLHSDWLEPDAQGRPVMSRREAMPALGYVEQEFFWSGQAQAHDAAGPWGDTPPWATRPHGKPQPFATRLIVRRPQDPSRFTGHVVVEWLNTTAGFDVDAGWALMADEMVREGDAWVGVSALSDGLAGVRQKAPSRYEALGIASKDLSYDIFVQAAWQIRQHAQAVLGVNPPRLKLLAFGFSGSAVFMSTYLNAIEPLAQAYDGFILHGSAPVSAPLNHQQWYHWAPTLHATRRAPVIQIQTEMEALVSWPLSRTQDTEALRYWEVAGAAHVGQSLQAAFMDIATPAFRSAYQQCLHPVDDLPIEHVDRAALHALREWVDHGVPAPSAPRLQRHALGPVMSDADGHGLGGLRLPEVAVPVAHHGLYDNISTRPWSFKADYLCIAGGSSQAFSAARLHALYASPQDYLQRFTRAADHLLDAGLLRPADHARSLQKAREQAQAMR